jgi:hypothetical protein
LDIEFYNHVLALYRQEWLETEGSSSWGVVRIVGGLVGWLVGWLGGGLVGCLGYWSDDWLGIGWFIDVTA